MHSNCSYQHYHGTLIKWIMFGNTFSARYQVDLACIITCTPVLCKSQLVFAYLEISNFDYVTIVCLYHRFTINSVETRAATNV